MAGHAGTTVFTNTSGVHRKGPDQSGRERWLIGLEVRRRGPIQGLSRLVFRTYGCETTNSSVFGEVISSLKSHLLGRTTEESAFKIVF